MRNATAEGPGRPRVDAIGNKQGGEIEGKQGVVTATVVFPGEVGILLII